MKLTNVKAVEFLAGTTLYKYDKTERIVEALVEAGFIIPDPPKPRHVEIADAAKGYLKTCNLTDPKAVFKTASGWDNEAWNHVIQEKTSFETRQEIFKALQYLANEAGV